MKRRRDRLGLKGEDAAAAAAAGAGHAYTAPARPGMVAGATRAALGG